MSFKSKLKEYSQQNNTNRLMPATWVVNISLDDDKLSFLLKWYSIVTIEEHLGTHRIRDRNITDYDIPS